MTDLVVADVGGTHARFALARLKHATVELGEVVVIEVADHRDFASAWQAFAQAAGPLPPAAAIAAAGPLRHGRIALTNAPWVVDPAILPVEHITLLNDFAAVAHAAAGIGSEGLIAVAGPDRPLPDVGTVSVLGPGTGLGVAAFHRGAGGITVLTGEGGHIGFAGEDAFEERVRAHLATRHARVVAEHVVAGPGIAALYDALGGTALAGDRAIWRAIAQDGDPIAGAAADRFCAALGTAAGDYALAFGAQAVVLAGGLATLLKARLQGPGFAARFTAKPRYEAMMRDTPVKLLAHPQPGLLGAALAYQAEHGARP